jgi:hypothetical protein
LLPLLLSFSPLFPTTVSTIAIFDLSCPTTT